MKKNIPEIKVKLFEKLKVVHPNKDFIVGVMSNVKTDSDRQTIIDFIDKGKEVTIENLILLSLHLNNKSKHPS